MKISFMGLRLAWLVMLVCAAGLLPAQGPRRTGRPVSEAPLSFSEDDFSSARPAAVVRPAEPRREGEPSSGGECLDDRYPHRVAAVRNGDTLLLDDGREVQLLGVDAPELVDPQGSPICFGREAAEFTRNALRGKCVRIEVMSGEAQKDIYGRTLAYVYFPCAGGGEECLNELLITSGYATAYPDQPHPDRMHYIEKQAGARAARKGLWGACYVWKSLGSLGAFETINSDRRWRRKGLPDILIRMSPLAAGGFQDVEPNFRRYDDGTVVELVDRDPNRQLLRWVREGEVGEGFWLSDVQRAMKVSPDIQVRDFVKPASRSAAFVRAYLWQNWVGVYYLEAGGW